MTNIIAAGRAFPGSAELADIRKYAIDIFSILFDVPDAENLLKIRLAELMEVGLPKRDKYKDLLIDEQYGVIGLAGSSYYASELLYGVDPVAYDSLATELGSRTISIDDSETEAAV